MNDGVRWKIIWLSLNDGRFFDDLLIINNNERMISSQFSDSALVALVVVQWIVRSCVNYYFIILHRLLSMHGPTAQRARARARSRQPLSVFTNSFLPFPPYHWSRNYVPFCHRSSGHTAEGSCTWQLVNLFITLASTALVRLRCKIDRFYTVVWPVLTCCLHNK